MIVLVAIAGLVLSAGAIAALVLTSGNGDGSSVAASTVASSTNSSTKKASTSKTTTAAQTTSTSDEGATREFLTAMDGLIADNARLEQLGISYANQVNSGGAAAVTDTMLINIGDLRMQFLDARERAKALKTPPAFSQVTVDFLQLNVYNTQRCDSLYKASVDWRNGQSTQADFAEGQKVKAAYEALYPKFEKEYAAARAAS